MRGLQQLRHEGSVAPAACGNFPNQGSNCVPFINRQDSTHWSCYLLFTRNEIETQRLACLRWSRDWNSGSDYSSRLSVFFSSLAPVTLFDLESS